MTTNAPLVQRHCVPCKGTEAPLRGKTLQRLQREFSSDWMVMGEKKLRREFTFADFTEAMKFVNDVAALAETEQHHPDISIFYNRVVLELWTHAINGLSENDGILAAKIDQIKKLQFDRRSSSS